MERDIQLLMPAYSIDMPTKECCGPSSDTQDPCSVFDQFSFPVDEFFPPRCETFQTCPDSTCRSCEPGENRRRC